MKSLFAGLVIGSARLRGTLEYHNLLFPQVFTSFLVAVVRPVSVSQNEPDFAAILRMLSRVPISLWDK